MHRFLVVIEKAKKNYSAYVPDLPGCVATGKTVAGVERRIHEAIALHLQGLRDDRSPIPGPSAISEYMAVTVP